MTVKTRRCAAPRTVVFGMACLALALMAVSATAAPVRLARYDFIVSGQEADTGLFAVPAGRNRTIIVTVHARTDTGPTADYVTVDWANLDGDAGALLTKARQAIRSVASPLMHQSTTLLYRHIDNAVSGDHSVRIRMANALTEAKVVHVHVMGNLDPAFAPVVGDTNGKDAASTGTTPLISSFIANVDYLVVDAATHNAGPSASVTGRAPVKTWDQQNNATPSIKGLTGYLVKTANTAQNFSYTLNVSDNWSIVAVRFRAAYTIDASAGANGAITPSGEVPVLSGGSQAFQVDANVDYVIAQVLVDGVPVTEAGGLETYTYTFTGVTAEHTIEATFSGRPVITVDPATVDMECDTTGYTELMAMEGVSASDPEDGDLTASIAMSNVTFPLITPGVYTILYDVVDLEGTPAGQKQRVVTIADTLAPVLSLNGADTMNLECNIDTYEEPGATAVDQCEGDLEVIIGGDTVDTAVTGTYLITYDVSDSVPLAADTLVRTVNVMDTTGPVITLLAASPVVLDGGAPYIEQGATAWDACEGDIPPESIVIDSGSVNTGVIGTHVVSYTASDGIGNLNTAYLDVIVQRETCKLIVTAPVTIVSALPDDEVTLEVALDPASCAVGAVSYEWKKQDIGGEFIVIPDALNSPMYTIAAAQLEDSGVYRCDVSDSMYTEPSPEITLTVGTGIPVAGLVGLALASAVTALAGAVALRKRGK